MAASAGIYAKPGSQEAPLASALAWLWRLGPPLGETSPGAVGIGGTADATDLSNLVTAGRLRGGIALCPGPGAKSGWVPTRRSFSGAAKFPGIGTIETEWTLFDVDGHSALDSDQGAHAVRADRLLAVGGGPDDWGRLSVTPLLAAIAPFLEEMLGRPLEVLPPVGVLRLDDFPGTAQHQLENRAAGDRRQARRMRGIRKALRRSDGVLNVAIAAQALSNGEIRPLDMVWSRGVGVLRDGAIGGELEPVCHGLLHLDPRAYERREIEFREFQSLDRSEADARIGEALAWIEERIARPRTFVAPAWVYGEHGVQAAIDQGLTPWLRAEAGPLLDGGGIRETLLSGPPGLHRLDYRPLAAMARLGLPPTVVTHGALLDNRIADLGPRDLIPFARLAVRRDLLRLPAVKGVRWIGAGEYLDILRNHEAPA